MKPSFSILLGVALAAGLGWYFASGKKPLAEPLMGSRPQDPTYQPDLSCFNRFDQWCAGFQKSRGENAAREALTLRGVELAKARKKEMVVWMREDPEGAIAHMVPRTVYPTLPEEVRQQVEKPLDLVAPYSVAVACMGLPRTDRILTVENKDLPVHTYGHRLGIGSKDHLPVHGFVLEGEVAMDASPVRLADARESAVPARLAGASRLLDLGGYFRVAGTSAEVRDTESRLQALERMPDPAIPGPTAAISGGVPGPVPTPDPAMATNWTHGTKKVLMARVIFSDDDPGDTVEELASLRKKQAVTEEFLARTSYGRLNLQTTILTNVLRLTNPSSTYTNNFLRLIRDSARVAQAHTNTNDFTFFTVVTTKHFPYGGMAGVVRGYAQLVQGFTDSRTASHEYGHNLGLIHANHWRSDSTNPVGQDSLRGTNSLARDVRDGEIVEYGHYFSVMSAQSSSLMNHPYRPSFAAAEKRHLAWLKEGEWTNVSRTSGGPVQLRLYQLETGATNRLRGIRIETPSTEPSNIVTASLRTNWTPIGRRYWLNYRPTFQTGTAVGYLPYGVQVDWLGPDYGATLPHLKYRMSGYNYTLSEGVILLDMTPHSRPDATTFYDYEDRSLPSYWSLDNKDKVDSPLVIGKTYSDPVGIHITPVGGSWNAELGENYLDVKVWLGSSPSNHAPQLSFARFLANPDGGVVAGQSRELAVIASDPDGDDLAYLWDTGTGEAPIASLNQSSFSHIWFEPGTYSVRCTVSDMRGRTASLSTNVVVTSTLAPAVSGGVSRIGSAEDDDVKALVRLKGGSFVMAGSSGGPIDLTGGAKGMKGILLAGYSPEGNLIWSRTIGEGGTQTVEAATPLPDGGLAIAGWIYGSVSFPSTGANQSIRVGVDKKDRYFVASLSANGLCRWVRLVGDSDEVWLGDLAVDGRGRIVVSGQFWGSVDFGGKVGRRLPVEKGDGLLLFYSDSGNLEDAWFPGLPETAGDDYFGKVQAGPEDSLYLIHWKSNPQEGGQWSPFLVRWQPALGDASAGFRWTASLQGPGADPWCVGFSANPRELGGDLFFGVDLAAAATLTTGTGRRVDYPEGSRVLRLAADTGALVWSWDVPGKPRNYLRDVKVTGTGEVLVGGSFYGSTDFGGVTLSSAGSRDLFVARLAEDASVLGAWRQGGFTLEDFGALVTGDDGRVAVASTFPFSTVSGFGANRTPLQAVGKDDICFSSFLLPGLPVLGGTNELTGTVGTAFSYQIPLQNGPASFSASGLPEGLSIHPTNGTISGTPVRVGTYTASIRATSSGGAGPRTLVLTVRPREISIVANTRTKLFGNPDPVLTYAGGEGEGLSGSLSREPGEVPGTYRILQGTLSAESNQTLRFSGANFTITRGSGGSGRPPVLLQSPAATSVVVGGGGRFTVVASNRDSSPLVYQWSRGTQPIPGATRSVLSWSNCGAGDAGDYRVVVANLAGAATSGLARLTVVAPPVLNFTGVPEVRLTAGNAFSWNSPVSGPTAVFTGMNLPPGLVLNRSNGIIAGNPPAPNRSVATITVSNAAGVTSFPVLFSIAASGLAIPLSDDFSRAVANRYQPVRFSAGPLEISGSVIQGKLRFQAVANPAATSLFPAAVPGVGSNFSAWIPNVSLPQDKNWMVEVEAGSGSEGGLVFLPEVSGWGSEAQWSRRLELGLAGGGQVRTRAWYPDDSGAPREITNPATGTLAVTSAIVRLRLVHSVTRWGRQLTAWAKTSSSANGWRAVGQPMDMDPKAMMSEGFHRLGWSWKLPPVVSYRVGLFARLNGLGSSFALDDLQIGAGEPPVVTSTSGLVGQVGVPFRYTLSATNTNLPTTYWVDNLPSWAVCDTNTGAITGTPERAGSFGGMILNVRSPSGHGVRTNPMVILPAWTGTNRFAGVVQDPNFRYAVAIGDHCLESELGFAATNLPPGLSLQAATGLITGKPTVAGTFLSTVSMNASGASASRGITFDIWGSAGGGFSLSLDPRPTYVANLPAGLSYNKGAGLISGTPQGWGRYVATGQLSNGATTNISIPVLPSAPVIAGMSNWVAQVGQPTKFQIVAGGFGREWAGWDDFSSNSGKWILSGSRGTTLLVTNGALLNRSTQSTDDQDGLASWQKFVPRTANWEVWTRAFLPTHPLPANATPTQHFKLGLFLLNPARSNGQVWEARHNFSPASYGVQYKRLNTLVDGAKQEVGLGSNPRPEYDLAMKFTASNQILRGFVFDAEGSQVVNQEVPLPAGLGSSFSPGIISECNNTPLPPTSDFSADDFLILPDPDEIEYRAYYVSSNGVAITNESGQPYLPGGLECDSRMGTIMGTVGPNLVGAYYRIRLEAEYKTNNLPVQGLAPIRGGTNVWLVVMPAFTSTNMVRGKVNAPFSHAVTLGTNLYGSGLRFAAAELPNGLVINTTSGVISGRPTRTGITTSIISVSYGAATASRFVQFDLSN